MSLSEEEKKGAVFRLIDMDAKGGVSQEEFLDFVGLFGPPLSEKEKKLALQMCGLEGKAKIDKKDVDGFFAKKIDVPTPQAETMKAFEVFDSKQNGRVKHAKKRSISKF
jgi:Ca2+-binding EF-hand superfamily protein